MVKKAYKSLNTGISDDIIQKDRFINIFLIHKGDLKNKFRFVHNSTLH